MAHKDAHRPIAPHGLTSSAHRGGPAAGDHATGRASEGELLSGATAPEVADGNCDALWIDIGGEG